MPSNDADEADANAISKPSWNMSPNIFPSYLMRLRRWLPHKDPRYNDLVECGVALDRGKVCCDGVTHLNAVRSSSIVKGSFAKPFVTTTLPAAAAGGSTPTAGAAN